LGVERLVHGVNLKPGKPLYVGRRGDRLVFGLPGNPVSSLVCFELFIRPAIGRLRGVGSAAWQPASLPLAAAWSISTDRDTFHPARLHRTSQGASVEPLPWLGSPDLLTLSRADALVRVPPGAHTFPAGATLPVLTLFGDFGA
jgi:molybdopterin molybdotransferase